MTTGGGKGEKILVSVRVRPRNDKEKTRNDICDWECVNNTTIICNNNLPERSLFPSTYTFDKVFGFDSPTKQVYEDGAKEVALCVLEGINSSIFAYGQTSSGKTYTMSGITEFAMNDIFCYIQKHKEREFTLKFSAIEIYNEAVRDLLSGDNNQLRLLDDPERGTVVEKLIEETLRDRTHLEELLSICETQRKIGETSLNETSSRSHQILRLTIESTGRQFSLESSRTLDASVCFVDLAGSERASQTLSAGARLKEGCHINRSLLTLGTVIRKLSKGRNGGHIPYRDSKLTRILQNSLGGNARTAIICTMSPARSHVEQSRNTLLFATCAKEVTTNAQVNLVVSEKALVKQLQQELARMENELKNIGSSSSSSAGSEFYSLLKQKEEVISQMEEQMKELKWQRDVAQSRVETLLKATAEERSSRMDEHSMLSSSDFNADLQRRSYDSIDIGEPSTVNNFTERNFELFENPEEDDFLVEDNIPQFSRYNLYNGWEEIVQTTNQKVEGEQSRVQAEPVESHDDIVDKKAVSEVLSPRKEETISSPEYQPSDSSLMGNNEQEEVEISTPAEKENVDLFSKTIDVESSPNAKPETSDLEMRSSVEVQETQKLVKEDEEEKKEERMTSSSTKQAEECSNKEEEDAQPEQQTKEHWELNSLPTKKQSEETIEVELVPDGAKLDEDDKYYSESSVYMSDDVDNSTYEALKEKVKEMQKKIKYLMSMHTAEQQSPCFRRDYKSPEIFTTKRSRSCRENLLSVRSPLWFDNLEASNNASPSSRVRELNASPGRPMNKTTSISFDSGSSMSSTPIDAQSLKDCDPQTGNSFQEFVAGLQEMARQHSLDSTPGLDYGIEIKPESPANALPNPHNRNEETTSDQLEREQGDDLVEDAVPKETDSTETFPDKGQYTRNLSDFERQQRQIIELWAVCNVPLVHRTYFFLLFKGDPSDYVYMEVELRRLSFLKQTINNDTETSRTQTVKALTREKEWLSKQIPKKFPWNQRIELYRKWGVEVNSKQRSLQVAYKVWTNTQDTEHIKESASLVAKLLGFVEASRMPKEMFGLSLLPGTENVKSSGWRFTKSFSSMRLTGS
ncbi:PREDICTED: kinesin-like protein NACK1 [Brassica oleracea var. oleracea]|uniref:kinesin-like protein NACK1 n=1 Tax=Brassica oleracea var. oleracea TaxID=109376 RepID=UPI0006A6AE7F|nr:PREDICTED: kinesin-like protein NACK1 [Brassica oleracea var. oleracea]